MTPAEELRAAAARLRAAAAPWIAQTKELPSGGRWYARGDLADALDTHVGTPYPDSDERWIVLASPALAEPLAAWLEDAMWLAEECANAQAGLNGGHEVTAHRGIPQALATARVINGGGS